MIKGIYINDKYAIKSSVYKLVDIKIDNIESPSDYIVLLYFENIKNKKDSFFESLTVFLKKNYIKVI